MAYTKSNANGQATMANSSPVVIASNQTSIPVDVQFGAGTIDSFGHLVTGTINNQVDIQFYRGDGSVGDQVTETNANGGTATATGGMATFSATTTASSQAKGVSSSTTTYTAGGEIYAIFTAGWTGTGAGTSYQRIGLYNDNDGFYLGKEANVFSVTVRKAGSDVAVPQASFSEDTLTGGATSLFTRNGVPEAVNFTKLNVWRIRFGWVGSAPINFEVLAPDGHWVTFHKIKQPNNASLPHINSADLPVTCDVFSGDSGNALTLITNCWAAGTTQALGKVNATITEESFASLNRSVITGETTAGGGGFVNVKVDPSGAIATSTVISSLPNEGQQTMANSISVAIASNQSAVPVSGTFYQATQPVSLASVPSHDVTNAGTFAVQVTSAPSTTVTATDLDIRNLTSTDVVTVTGGAGQTADVKVTLDGETVPVTGTFWQATQPVSGTVTANATLAAETTKVIGTVNVAAGQTIATTNAGTFAVQQTTYSSSSVTQVSSSASSVQLLASTAGRKGAYFFNDSTAIAYLKLGTTAATNSYTVKMAAGSFYELPYPCYTGRIDCIWASANGVMAITELS